MCRSHQTKAILIHTENIVFIVLFHSWFTTTGTKLTITKVKYIQKSKKRREVSALGKKHDCSKIIIKSLNMSRLDPHMLHPSPKNLAYFLGPSLSSFSLFPSSSLHFKRFPLFHCPPPTHFLSFSQTKLLLTSRCNFQFAESFLASDRGVTLTNSVQVVFYIVSGRWMSLSLPQRTFHGSQNIWQLFDLNIQLFGGSELRHQPQTGSGESVGCQLNPTLKGWKHNHNLWLFNLKNAYASERRAKTVCVQCLLGLILEF